MFCKYCGNELPENANFCPKCGKINEDASKDDENEITVLPSSEDNHEDIEVLEAEDPFKKEKTDLGGSILKFAILGLAFSLTVWFSLLGLIFSIVARNKVKEYISKFNETEGRATVGKSLSIAGLAVGITFTCLMSILVIVFIAALAA